MSHWFGLVIRSTDADGNVTYTHSTSQHISTATTILTDRLKIPCKSGMITSGHSADTHGFVGYQPKKIFFPKMSKNLDGNSPILGGLKSTSLSRYTCHRSPSKAGILMAHLCTRVSSPLSGILIADLFPCYSKMTTYGHLNDTHGLTGLEPNLVNNPFVVAWADTQKPHGSRAGCGLISSIRL